MEYLVKVKVSIDTNGGLKIYKPVMFKGLYGCQNKRLNLEQRKAEFLFLLKGNTEIELLEDEAIVYEIIEFKPFKTDFRILGKEK